MGNGSYIVKLVIEIQRKEDTIMLLTLGRRASSHEIQHNVLSSAAAPRAIFPWIKINQMASDDHATKIL